MKVCWVADKAKASSFMRGVKFCGHVLGGGKRSPAPGKLAAVQKWPLPPTVTALRGFLGLCNYYCRYEPMFTNLAAGTASTCSTSDTCFNSKTGNAGSYKHHIA